VAQPRRTSTRTRSAPPDDTVHDPDVPIDQIPPAQEAHPDEPRPEDEGEVTGTELLHPREIEVDPIVDPPPTAPDPQGMVVIRMNTTLEDFTYGNPHHHMRLEEGKRYRVPLHIGQYLDGLGYVWH
jgi:hypothetical protein